MADIALTAARIASCFADGDRGTEIVPVVLAATVTAGQALYINSDGKADLADANGSGTLQIRGIALMGGGAGATISMLKRGYMYGFTVAAVAYDAPLFLSNTAGALADGAGGTSINVGRVVPLTDVGALTKVVWIDCDWLRTWA